jgi:hypothetical protein
MTTFTVILPHKRNPGNDAALVIALEMLTANTVNDFILLMDAAYDQPLYPRVDAMVVQATTECCVYWSSDMFPAPNWDVPMLELYNEHSFVTNTLVEPGAIGVWHQNLTEDFGRRADNFRRAEFEQWCKTAPVPDGEGWFAPYMFPRSGYLAHGGLDRESVSSRHGGWTTSDMDLFECWKASGNRVIRARGSFTYHLQRYSDEGEQMHEKRGG